MLCPLWLSWFPLPVYHLRQVGGAHKVSNEVISSFVGAPAFVISALLRTRHFLAPDAAIISCSTGPTQRLG